MKNSFWGDAALYGAFLGLAEIVFTTLELSVPFPGLGLLHFAVFVALLVLFTRRRVRLYGSEEAGYSYGECLKYILCMSLFAGVLVGAYTAVAANFFFPEKYQAVVDQALSVLSQSGMYTGEMLRQMQSMMRRMIFSPVWVLFSNVFSYAFKGVFCGLIVAAFTKRTPQLFGPDQTSDHE